MVRNAYNKRRLSRSVWASDGTTKNFVYNKVSAFLSGTSSGTANMMIVSSGTGRLNLVKYGTISDDGTTVTFTEADIRTPSVPAEDPLVPGMLFTDGVPEPGTPKTLKVSGGPA